MRRFQNWRRRCSVSYFKDFSCAWSERAAPANRPLLRRRRRGGKFGPNAGRRASRTAHCFDWISGTLRMLEQRVPRSLICATPQAARAARANQALPLASRIENSDAFSAQLDLERDFQGTDSRPSEMNEPSQAFSLSVAGADRDGTYSASALPATTQDRVFRAPGPGRRPGADCYERKGFAWRP